MQTNPLHTFDICHFLDEFGNMLFSIDIHTIVGQLLGDHLKLFCSLSHQGAYFLQDLLHGTTLVLTSNNRNGAIGTMAVTALRDFDIGIVARGGQMAGATYSFYSAYSTYSDYSI